MNCHQLVKLVLALSCIGCDVLAGVLPGSGGGGYQYGRSGSGGAGGFVGSDVGFGRGGGSGSGDYGIGYRSRPSQAYGPPGGRGGEAFGRSGVSDSVFGGQQSSYGHSQVRDGFGSGGGGGGRGYGGYGGRDSERPRPYNFHYEVVDPPSGNDYSHRESSDGNVVQGEYRVLLPDSRTQIVRYMADDVNGYNADVQYEGQARVDDSRGYQGGGYGSGYQGGRGDFGGHGGGFGGHAGGFGGHAGGFGGHAGSFGGRDSGFGGRSDGFGGDSAINKYLPPHNYRK